MFSSNVLYSDPFREAQQERLNRAREQEALRREEQEFFREFSALTQGDSTSPPVPLVVLTSSGFGGVGVLPPTSGLRAGAGAFVGGTSGSSNVSPSSPPAEHQVSSTVG